MLPTRSEGVPKTSSYQLAVDLSGADRSLSDDQGETALAVAERRAQCRAQDRPAEMGASAARHIPENRVYRTNR